MSYETEHTCWKHSLVFKGEAEYNKHKDDCDNLLQKNMCIYVEKNGEHCKKTFKETGSLIIHYFVEHKEYACTRCYSTFITEKELEGHHHTENINLRLSK